MRPAMPIAAHARFHAFLEVAEAGAAVPALVEARSLAGLAVEDERAVRPPPGLLALDHRHQLGRVLGVDRDLLLVARLIQLRPERESPVRCRVVPPLEAPRRPDPPRAEEEEEHDVG